jgi:hypothetical protein
MPPVSPGPHFLGIGAQRAGTTWLYANLSAQPGIWMPPVKELHYFDEKAHVGTGFLVSRLFGRREVDRRWRRQLGTQWRSWRRQKRRPTRWELRYLLGRPSDTWYLTLFRRGDRPVTGEITPNYMILDPADLEHLRRLLPDARIILMVRNPIERAWSSSMMMTGDGSSPEAAAIVERERSQRQTDYLGALDRWRRCFPAERIYVGFMEDVIRQPEELLSGICRFLGVAEAGKFRRAGKVIHQGSVSTMPAAMAGRLAEMYAPLARDMAGRFGGYAGFWAFCADRLQAVAGGDKEVGYPFCQTPLWEEWLAAGGQPPEGLQSGTLDQVDRGR